MKRILKLRTRMADGSDLQNVLTLYSGAIRKMRGEGIDQWDELYPDGETLSADIEKREMLLLTQGGEAISATVVNGEQLPEYESVGWHICRPDLPGVIHRLCVSAGAQRKGLGTQTLEAAEQFAFARGYHAIRLDAFAKNPAALRLYESAGYKKAGYIMLRKGLFFCYEKLLEGVK
jgi:ribosomal protein S18 acetylase RimI-like enzyme